MKFYEVEPKAGSLEWLIRKDGCMHCEDPGCLKACPAPGAIVQYSNGIVDFIHDNCIGCEMCTQTCPFNATSMHTTTDEDRARETFFQIPDGVFEIGKFAKGFDRGIKLARVKG